MTGQTDITVAFTPAPTALVDAYFLSLGMGVNAHRLRRDRADLLNWLNAQSDADLAAMGLSRSQIPAHVFRDLFG